MNSLLSGIEILRDDCKVMLPKWLPYQTMLPPLAAVLARMGSPKNAEAGAHREKLKRWFWCGVFGQVYDGAPNSKAAKDVVEIPPWLAGGALPESVASFQLDPKAMRDVTPRQRADLALVSLWIAFNSLYGQWDKAKREPKPDRECCQSCKDAIAEA